MHVVTFAPLLLLPCKSIRNLLFLAKSHSLLLAIDHYSVKHCHPLPLHPSICSCFCSQLICPFRVRSEDKNLVSYVKLREGRRTSRVKNRQKASCVSCFCPLYVRQLQISLFFFMVQFCGLKRKRKQQSWPFELYH